MRKRGSMLVTLVALLALATSPVAGRGAKVDQIAEFDTVLAVAMPDDFPIASLMRAHCSTLIRIERPDGSATEVQDCQLSNEPVMVPGFQGVPPTSAFILEGGACQWSSDFWFNVQGIDVLAESFHYTVTPSGHVHVRTEYPPEPLACEE